MKTNRLLLSLLILGVVLFSAAGLNAQSVTGSIIREDAEIWTPLVNPTSSKTGNDFVITIPLPFAFTYDGTSYGVNTPIYAYENGWISFNQFAEPAATSMPSFPNLGGYRVISWYMKDLFTTGSLSYKTEGTTPFRVLTIQHLGAKLLNDFSGNTFDAQVKLYETTNEVKIIYNTVNGFGYSELNGYLGFQGSGGSNFINIKPNAPTVASTFYYGNSNPNANPWLSQDVRKYFYRGRSFTLSSTPKLSGIYPANNAVLASGKLYQGDEKPYVRVSRAPGNKPIVIRYTITGPLNTPQSSVIYTSLDAPDLNAPEKVNPNPQPEGTGIRVQIPYAKGIAARLSDGALDLRDISKFPSGQYRIDAVLEYLDGTPYSSVASSTFMIAFQNDLAINNILEPVFNPGSIYQFGGPGVPVKILVKNQGADPVTSFVADYFIYDAAGTLKGRNIPQDTFRFSNDPLLFGQEREFTFPDLYHPADTGLFNIKVSIDLQTSGADKFMANNTYPRTGDPVKNFRIAYAVEAAIAGILNSTGIYNNRPFRLIAKFLNNGVSDISNSVVKATIRANSTNGPIVYEETGLLKDLPSGLVKEAQFIFDKPFIPSNGSGTYYAIFEIIVDNDEVPNNNSTGILALLVQPGMSGTYTIKKTGGNFATIGDALNALYIRGVEAPVTFLMSDAVYVEGNPSSNAPALDFGASIVGLGPDFPNNTVTFTVDPQFATRSSVQINLFSASGIGINFGQSTAPSNVNAPIFSVNTPLVPKYANSPQNIIFDGGPKKSLKFTIGTTNNFRAVFYLGNTASKIQLKNLLIEDGLLQAISSNCYLPLSSFNSFLNKFEYEADVTAGGTYSAGIVMRSLPPFDSFGANSFHLDTLGAFGNIISGNEIQKFGYGVVSLGMGQLLNFHKLQYQKYYNHDNHINNNIINNVAKSAVFLGYEMNTEIYRNRIYNVQGACGDYTAGIAAGGEARTGRSGYNNVGLYISSNEISNIRGGNDLYGISIVQAKNDYFNLDTPISFPDQNENVKIINNIIWGFETQNPASSIIGILLSTERLNGFNWSSMTFAPKFATYYTRNDLVTNNTIILGDDGVLNTGAVLGISVLNTKNLKLVNNAIEINDLQIDPNNPATAALFIYGLHAKKGGFESDRNAYWVNIPDAAIVRFIETDLVGRIIEPGYKREFAALNQWQNWTNQDWNSVYGNFSQDMVLTGLAPFAYRINDNPLPMGSILNNRGIKVEGNNVDIDGKMRGEAGEKYDIGAIEFRGRTFGRDGEAVAFLTPGSYQATAPMAFSDAEYIMTTAPVAVKAIIRNNGQLPVASQNAVLKISRQLPNGSYLLESTVNMPMNDLTFSDDVTVDFLTADGITNAPTNIEFFPQPYGQFRKTLSYNIPDQFKAMEANVTPMYKLEISLSPDEMNANNTITKYIRFYIRKSPIQALISAENIKTTPLSASDPLDIIAANLNLDTLKTAFTRLGWVVDLDREDPRVDYDVFDRKQWEPRSVNYPMYHSIFWVDGHDFDASLATKRITRYDRDQIEGFLASGTVDSKKNFFMSSQEIVRNETPFFPDWLRNNLSAKIGNPENPMGPSGNYNGQSLTGVIIGRDFKFRVKSTGFTNDDFPRVAANLANNPGFGTTLIGMKYDTHINDIPDGPKVADSKRIAVLATTYIKYNIIFAGIDWRHFANIDDYLRSAFDYADYNNGRIIPIEMLAFDAKQAGNRVDLTWITASEINSSKFIIEKSEMTQTGKNFVPFEEVAAAGSTSSTIYYGPIVDTQVEMGKSYIYRLKMIDKDGNYGYSDERIVTLTSLDGTISMEDVKPNPASTRTNVEFNLGNDMDVNVSLYDMNGNEVALIANGKLSKGIHVFTVNLSELPSGAYTVILKGSNVVLTSKLNVVK